MVEPRGQGGHGHGAAHPRAHGRLGREGLRQGVAGRRSGGRGSARGRARARHAVRTPTLWRRKPKWVARRFHEMTSDSTWQRLETVAKAAAIVHLPGKASEPFDTADAKKYIHLLHLKDQKHALLGPGGSRLQTEWREPASSPPSRASSRTTRASSSRRSRT